MRVLVNASTCVIGGGVQVASSFIRMAQLNPCGHTFLFAVSDSVWRNTLDLCKDLKNDHAIVKVSPSPAKIIHGGKSRGLLRSLESEFSPDVVFTVFGPAYMKYKARHVCGFADPWVTHASKIALNSLSFKLRLLNNLRCTYKRLNLSSVDYYWVEANVAKFGLMEKCSIDSGRICVIPNCFSQVFEDIDVENGQCEKGHSCEVKIFTLSSPYYHKNLNQLPDVANIVNKLDPESRYIFYVTLPEQGQGVKNFWKKVKRLDVEKFIKNIGVIKVSECPKWYLKSDIVFLPTLLETFSVTYLEAMKMKRPIVTTDLDFAHDICGDAALYYNPASAESAAQSILRVASNPIIKNDLVRNGSERLKQLPDPLEKYLMHLRWLEDVCRIDNA